jgi:hypothetical protein
MECPLSSACGVVNRITCLALMCDDAQGVLPTREAHLFLSVNSFYCGSVTQAPDPSQLADTTCVTLNLTVGLSGMASPLIKNIQCSQLLP